METFGPVDDLPPQHALTIHTPRLLLRPVRPNDLHPLHAIRRDPLTMRFMGGGGPDPEAVAEKSDSVKRIHYMMMPDRFSFAIELRDPAQPDSSLLIGFMGIFRIPEVFYLFDSKHWGRGYATEALRALVGRYWAEFPRGLPGMEEKGMGRYLEGKVLRENAGSGRVLEKVGFVFQRESKVEMAEVELVDRIYRLERPGVRDGSGEVVKGTAEVTEMSG